MTAPISRGGCFALGLKFGSTTSPSSGSADVFTRTRSSGIFGTRATGRGEGSETRGLAVRPKNLAMWYEEEIPDFEQKWSS